MADIPMQYDMKMTVKDMMLSSVKGNEVKQKKEVYFGDVCRGGLGGTCPI
jgi:hypothetical protein